MNIEFKMFSRVSFAIVATLSSAHAANTWTGSLDSDFNTGANYVENNWSQWTDYIFDTNAVNPAMNVDDFTGWGNISLNSGLTNDIFISGAQPIIMAPAMAAVWGYDCGGTITLAADSKNLSVNTSFLISGTLNMDVGTGRTLTANGAVNFWDGLGHPASLNKQGDGTAVLAGANNYTGGTTINEGTLSIGNWGSTWLGTITVGNTASITGTLNITSGTLNLGGNSIFAGASGGIGIVNQSGGAVSFTSGNGLLVGNGATGTYNLSSGTLTGFSSTSRGVMIGVNNSSTATFNLSGTGNLNLGTGELAVGRNDEAATGCTVVYNQTGGTASVGYLSIGGQGGSTATIATFSLTGGTFSADNFQNLVTAASSSATLTLGTSAQVTLPAFPTRVGTANLTFDFTSGSLSPFSASTSYMSGLTHAYLTANGATFNVDTGKDITIAQVLENAPSQAGKLTKLGSGTLTLTAPSTYSGGTTITAGTLQLGDGTSGKDGSLLGNITNNAALVYNVFGNQKVGSAISGTGTLTKVGAGTLTLSGANSYTGETMVNAGTLRLSAPLLTDNFTTTGTPNTYDLNYNLANRQTGTEATKSWTPAGNTQVGNNTPVQQPSGTGADYLLLAFGGQAKLGDFGLSMGNVPGPVKISFDMFKGNTGIDYSWTSFSLTASGNAYPITGSGELGFLYRYNTGIQVFNNGGPAILELASTPGGDSFAFYLSDGAGTGSPFAGNGTRVIITQGGSVLGSYALDTGMGTSYLAFGSDGGMIGGVDNLAVTPQQTNILAPTNYVSLTAAGATLELDNVLQTVAGLDGVAGTSVALGPLSHLTVNGDTDSTFSGGISGILSALTKSGIGMLTLAGTNTYIGKTTVSNGTLRIDGDCSGATGALTVEAGARLGGNGSYGGNITLNAGAGLYCELNRADCTLACRGQLSFDNLNFANCSFTVAPGVGYRVFTLIEAASLGTVSLVNAAGTIEGVPAKLFISGSKLMLGVGGGTLISIF
jgi:autotransporter-associated beta strand protein